MLDKRAFSGLRGSCSGGPGASIVAFVGSSDSLSERPLAILTASRWPARRRGSQSQKLDKGDGGKETLFSAP
eukprot:5121701-Pyramimonas_sp.AAC.1